MIIARLPLTSGASINTNIYDKPASEESGAAVPTLEIRPYPGDIAIKAYFIYLDAGSPPGFALQHWLTAENDLLAEQPSARVHGLHN